MTQSSPLVSAVIPTRNRPDCLLRAIRSVLDQSHPHIEVVVVIDGEDSLTRDALSKLEDPRVLVRALCESVGGSEARNIGARMAEGEWIAFLDDDDEWLPNKIEMQLQAVSTVVERYPLVCGQVIARSATGDAIWPENAPRKPYSEYLTVRNRLSYGEGLMQTSSLMAPRELLHVMPFTKGLPKHQDWDWVLRCASQPDVKIVYVPTPLAIWNLDVGGSRVSKTNRWRDSLRWIRDMNDMVTPRAYASFMAFYVAPQAANDGAYREFFPLLKEMVWKGSARPLDLAVYLGAWLTPHRFKNFLRSFRHRHTKSRS